MIIYAKLQSSHLRHQYGIFSGKSQTSFLRNATRAGSEEGQLFSQAIQGFQLLYLHNLGKKATIDLRVGRKENII